jgi:uncharacterized protein
MGELEIMGVSSDGSYSRVVLLRHEDRFLPIMVGPAEADAILAALTNRDLGRPMTHDLICNLLAGLRGEIKAVTIYKLENETFYAYLNLEQKTSAGQVDQVLRIDSRPSDGIAIACRVNAPIFAADEVMDAASQDMSILSSEDDADDQDAPDFE